MFLVLLACQVALVAANPFHKYPYVFLLDIGNEEIKKTNTEQIRLSSPGGSIALRYPAVGTGDTIAHVRVSGIDFGTDLKASVIDGGPGYKYVVLVLMGNQGTPYDAVLTVQTVSDEDLDGIKDGNVSNSYNSYKVAEDDNNSAEIKNEGLKAVVDNASDENISAEDTNDEVNPQNVVSKNSQLAQQSLNVYSYANRGTDYEDGMDEDTSNEKNTNDESYRIYNKNADSQLSKESPNAYPYMNRPSYDADEDDDTTNEKDSVYNYDKVQNVDNDLNAQDETNGNPGSNNFDDDYGNEDTAEIDKKIETFEGVDNRGYEKLQPAMPLRMYDGLRIYPQYAVPFALPSSDKYTVDGAIESDHSATDDEDNKYKDSNNNLYDSDDASAIAS